MLPILKSSASRATKAFLVLLVVSGSAGGSYAVTQVARHTTNPSVSDTTPPPAPTVTAHPSSVTNATTAAFWFTDAERGVSFRCQLDRAPFSGCTSPRRYPGPLAEGRHTFAVQAVDRAGNASPAASYAWTIDTSRPPAPTITSRPSDPTTATTASFSFTDAEAGVGFRCRLDSGSFTRCTSPKSYSGLSASTHTFRVQAFDAAGNASPTTSYSWAVQASVAGFILSGSISPLLYPGAIAPLDMVITNPFDFAIQVSGVAVTPQRATTRNGQPNPACDGTVNLTVFRPYSGPAQLKVLSHRTVSLSELGLPPGQWPQLQMPNLAVNQDACKSIQFSLDFTAQATKVTP